MRAAAALSRTTPETAQMALWAKSLALARGHRDEAMQLADAMGAPPRVKAAIAAGSTSNPDLATLADAGAITTAFIPFLRQSSLFYAVLEGAVQVPLETRIGLTTATATGFMVGEGAAVPLQTMELSGLKLETRKACALITLTNEMLRATGPGGEALISRELRRGIAATADAEFLDLAVDSGTATQASLGNDADASMADVAWLLDQVQPNAESKLVWGLSADVARAAATMRDAGGYVFPGMGPTGGTILNSPAVVSDALSAGTVFLIDASGIAANAGVIRLKASGDTTIEMADEPSGNATTPTATNSVSMFQTNSTAIMAFVFFGAERFRDEAVATVTDVAWGAPTG